MPDYVLKARKRANVGPRGATASEMVDLAVEGADPNALLERSLDNPPDPLVLRRNLRRMSPSLYNFLSDAGVLHEFALDVASGVDSWTLIHKYEIPRELQREVGKVR